MRAPLTHRRRSPKYRIGLCRPRPRAESSRRPSHSRRKTTGLSSLPVKRSRFANDLSRMLAQNDKLACTRRAAVVFLRRPPPSRPPNARAEFDWRQTAGRCERPTKKQRNAQKKKKKRLLHGEGNSSGGFSFVARSPGIHADPSFGPCRISITRAYARGREYAWVVIMRYKNTRLRGAKTRARSADCSNDRAVRFPQSRSPEQVPEPPLSLPRKNKRITIIVLHFRLKGCGFELKKKDLRGKKY